jgi:rod shape-determining protein MreC
LAKDRNQDTDYAIQIRRLLVGVLVLCLIAIFLIWRVDSPRIERFRAQVIDTVVPSFDWAMAPVTGMVNILRDFQSYQRIYEQNQELRRELQKMKSWREAALQLEQENARLLDLNNVQLDPRLTFVTGVVLADSGSPFRQSVLINVGSRDGIVDGWAAMDGLGLVGRISGVGDNTARVILLTDTSSRIPVTIQPSGQHAIVAGDNTAAPLISFVEEPDEVRPGDRVMTSGDGGVFPAGLLVGELARDPGGRLRVRLSADYERLEFLRVLRNWQETQISETGQIVRPDTEPDADPGAEPVGDTAPDADTPEANPLAAPLEPVGEAADG